MSVVPIAPGAPPGWEAVAGTLLTLDDPAGLARAWFAPDIGGNTVGFAVRTDRGWVHLIATEGPELQREKPTRFGVPVLFPFPGHTRDGVYHWQGTEYRLPGPLGATGTITHGFAHKHPWHVTAQEQDTVTARFATPANLPPDEQAAYPFHVTVTHTVRIVDGTLHLTLAATNEGDNAAPVGIALHPYFAVDVLGGKRDAVRVHLPGRTERVLEPPIPTGETRPAPPDDFAGAPVGAEDTRGRTGITAGEIATLTGPSGTGRISLTLTDGVRDILYFNPPWQSSISLEPHSLMPSAASFPEGHPDGLPALAPGATVRLGVIVSWQGN